MLKVLVTCPPMIGMQAELDEAVASAGFDVEFASVVQTLTEDELIERLPAYDGWIIGDDPATRRVLDAGKSGRLKAAVKWGVGVDNVDFDACKDLGISVANTPGMFGQEVADMAIGYLIGLARQTFRIDREVRAGGWPKYRGTSLSGKQVGLAGFGDIGRQVHKRLEAMGCEVAVYDPFAPREAYANARFESWPDGVPECDALIFTCALTPSSRHMLNADVIAASKPGVMVINVARGGLIEQPALIEGLSSGQVGAAALDVFEEEPLGDSPLLQFEQCIFGTHNASNTKEAVMRTSLLALDLMAEGLGQNG